MIEPEFLEADVVLYLHDQALREYGGIQGVKNAGLLESALGRAVNKFACDGATLDLFDLAAAYAFGLATNHPFNDGNERTAWGSCVLFLKVNGVAITAGAADVVDAMIGLVDKAIDETALAAWLRCTSKT